MDTLDALDRASAEFRRRLVAVADDQWAAPTPCPDWSVRLLVNHVVAGNVMASLLAPGAALDEVMPKLAGDHLGDDPLGAYDRSAAGQVDAFAADGTFHRIVHHPAGDMPGWQFCGFRLVELVLHGWDLARATGGDERLDPELLDMCWKFFSPLGRTLPASGRFGSGASGSLPDDADLQTRLLDLSGRRP